MSVKSIHVGFTGTREGMSNLQYPAMCGIFRDIAIKFDRIVVHHGVCVGADEQFHKMCQRMILSELRRIEIIGHPGPLSPTSSKCDGFFFKHDPRPYVTRDRDIVVASTVVIGAPLHEDESRSGTWKTIGFARKFDRPCAIVRRDGIVNHERWYDFTTEPGGLL